MRENDIIDDNLNEASIIRGYQFGRFVINAQSKALQYDSEDVTIEPKVAELLLFLCRENNRYLLLQELHDNVWSGRVVSDAAVRRSISKLRSILGKDEEGNSLIKSASKRGYKLNMPVRTLNSTELERIEPSIPVATESGTAALAKSKQYKAIVFLFILIVSCVLLMTQVQRDSSNEVWTQESVIEFPGQKGYIDVSFDKEVMAFTNRLIGSQGDQVFIGAIDGSDIKQITQSAKNVSHVIFGEDNQHLFVVDLILGQSEIFELRLSDDQKVEQRETIISDFFFLSEVVYLSQGNELYFTGMKNKSDSSQLYQYTIDTKVLKPISVGYSEGAHDYRLALSADGKHLAIATVMANAREQRISIYDLETTSIETRFYHDKPLYQMGWHNSESMYLLDEMSLSITNIHTGSTEVVVKNDSNRIDSFIQLQFDELMLLKDKKPRNMYLEVPLPDFDIESQHMVSNSDGSFLQMIYAKISQSKLVLSTDGQTKTMHPLGQSENEQYFTTSLPAELYETSPDSKHILLKLNNQLALVNREYSNVNYLTGGGQLLEYGASISPDGRFIFYGERTPTQWVVKSYEIDSGKTDLLFEGYKAARRVTNGYIAIDESFSAFFISDSNDEVESLDLTITVDLNTRWIVREDMLYWSTFDMKMSTFHSFDLVTRIHKHISHPYSLISTRFDVNQAGTRALLKNKEPTQTDIVRLMK